MTRDAHRRGPILIESVFVLRSPGSLFLDDAMTTYFNLGKWRKVYALNPFSSQIK